MMMMIPGPASLLIYYYCSDIAAIYSYSFLI